MIVCGFEYFAKSRGLYQQLRIDYQLSTTLTRLTSKNLKHGVQIFIEKPFPGPEF